MEKSTEIKNEESCVEKDIGILRTRAKEYEKDLNQVVSTPIPKSKKKPQIILFIKCSDHVGTSFKSMLDENAQYLSCIKFESVQTLKPGVVPRNCNVISFLMTGTAQNNSKKVNSFYECAIIVTLKWVFCNIYPASIWTVECKIEGLFKMCGKIKKFAKKSCIYPQKSSKLLSIQRNFFDLIGKF